MDDNKVWNHINDALYNSELALDELVGDGGPRPPKVQTIIEHLFDADLALEKARRDMREVMNG